MAVAFNCPRCRDEIYLDNPKTNEVVCPHCSARVDIPPNAAIVEDNAAPAESFEIVAKPGVLSVPSLEKELSELHKRESNPWRGILMLIGTVILFILIASVNNTPLFVASLVVVLFIHELGHVIGMKAFGYKDVRMLFLPMLGAAALGRDDSPSATRQAIVSLLGPIPGIVLAIVAIIVFPVEHEAVRMFAVVALFLNTINLLPLHPLDGARILQFTLFARAPRLRVFFQLVTLLGLIMLGFMFGEAIIGTIGVLLLFGIPMAWAEAKAATKLKSEMAGITGPLPSEIPQERLQWFVNHFDQEASSNFKKPKVVAQMSQRIWDTVRTPPAAVGTAIFVLMTQGAFIVLGLVFFLLVSSYTGQPDISGMDSTGP